MEGVGKFEAVDEDASSGEARVGVGFEVCLFLAAPRCFLPPERSSSSFLGRVDLILGRWSSGKCQ